MRPEAGVAVGRPDLGAIAWEFMEDSARQGYIGLQVMPRFDVAEKTAQYPTIPREVLLKIPSTRRAAKAGYNRAPWEFGMDNYTCEEDGWEEVIDDVERKLYRRFFDAERVATLRATSILLRSMEKRIADTVFNATTFTAHAVTNEWDDTANATPLADVKAGKLAIRAATGLTPNALVITYSTFLDLGLNAEILNRIKYTNPGITPGEISVELLSQYFGVQVIVGNAVYDSAKKGKAATVVDIWNKEYAMLCRVASGSQADVLEPSLGRTFLWTEDAADTLVTESYRDNEVRGDVVRVRQQTAHKVLSVDSAYLMNNITT